MARRRPPRKVTYFEPVPPRLARNTIIESTFKVDRHYRCTMRVDCGQTWGGDPAGTRRMAPAYTRAPRALTATNSWNRNRWIRRRRRTLRHAHGSFGATGIPR